MSTPPDHTHARRQCALASLRNQLNSPTTVAAMLSAHRAQPEDVAQPQPSLVETLGLAGLKTVSAEAVEVNAASAWLLTREYFKAAATGSVDKILAAKQGLNLVQNYPHLVTAEPQSALPYVAEVIAEPELESLALGVILTALPQNSATPAATLEALDYLNNASSILREAANQTSPQPLSASIKYTAAHLAGHTALEVGKYLKYPSVSLGDGQLEALLTKRAASATVATSAFEAATPQPIRDITKEAFAANHTVEIREAMLKGMIEADHPEATNTTNYLYAKAHYALGEIYKHQGHYRRAAKALLTASVTSYRASECGARLQERVSQALGGPKLLRTMAVSRSRVVHQAGLAGYALMYRAQAWGKPVMRSMGAIAHDMQQ